MHLHVGIQLIAWLSGAVPALVLGYALGARRGKRRLAGAYLLGYRTHFRGEPPAPQVVALLGNPS